MRLRERVVSTVPLEFSKVPSQFGVLVNWAYWYKEYDFKTSIRLRTGYLAGWRNFDYFELMLRDRPAVYEKYSVDWGILEQDRL